MRIITFCVTLSYFLALVQSIDEHRPKNTKKEKRQLDYAFTQHYSGPHSYRSERRLSNPPSSSSFYSQSPYHPGPLRPYRKDPGQDLANNHQDVVDRGGSGDTIYIPHKPLIKYIEKPVYIKEPEPIIEIIIKESNVTLPPLPTEPPAPPQKKKKEEVQVFYVKYKKNPNGYGKDAVIYDKPIAAISPQVPEEPEPQEEWKEAPYPDYSNEVTEPPKPSTTLRTIIKPDSEIYHSPGNNVKVTFGKEGFDYEKRSSKPEDYPGPPRARQLTSYSDVYFKRPIYQSEMRPPQSYRPFNTNNRPSFFPPPKSSSRPSFPNFSHSISHPPPAQYQPPPGRFSEALPPGQRKPVPYTPFDKIRQQSFNFRPEAPHYNQPFNSQFNQQQHFYNNHQQSIVPAGGQLIHSLPKFEQHLVVDQTTGQVAQSFPQESLSRANKQVKQQQNQGQNYRQQSFGSKNVASQRSEQSTTRIYSTTPTPTTTTQEPEKPSTTTKDPKILEAQLPDEVPEELRAQLLSSGILNHADISILDYDKVGDIPLSDLPPDQLANFYSAGGAQQLSAAAPQFAALTSRKDSKEQQVGESQVAMKVVKYNPDSEKGQKVQEAYLSSEAKKVDPVVLNDNSYNRYLPLKLNGTQFPIPNVPELNGKLISSVVVLAPISYDFSSGRKAREAKPQNDLELLRNEPLKVLLENPSQENFRKFLDNEKKASVSQQAVILLVAGQNGASASEKEIFMYDIVNKTVSKLNGELSSAFVEAAEANSSDEGNYSDGQRSSEESKNAN